MSNRKPILCLDFDGVLHSYKSGWQGAESIPDAPVLGAFDFIRQAQRQFRVSVYSSRSSTATGIAAMQGWFDRHAGGEQFEIEWPVHKPSAFVSIDDRALTFDGTWPSLPSLLNFRPWWKTA